MLENEVYEGVEETLKEIKNRGKKNNTCIIKTNGIL